MDNPSALPRKSISPRTRFNIFKRDGFVCQYCGNHPPSVLLEIDHIIPVSKGGKSETENYVTACEKCNRGKAAILLSDVPISLVDRAAKLAEKEKQLKGYTKISEARRLRLDAECWDVVHLLDEKMIEARRDWITSIKRFLEELGYSEVMAAMELAKSRKPFNNNLAFRYFCGICWNKIKDKAGISRG